MNRPITFGTVAYVAILYMLVSEYGTIAGCCLSLLVWPLFALAWHFAEGIAWDNAIKSLIRLVYEKRFAILAFLTGLAIVIGGILRIPLPTVLCEAVPGVFVGFVIARWIGVRRGEQSRALAIAFSVLGGVSLLFLANALDNRLVPASSAVEQFSAKVNRLLPRQIDASTRFVSTEAAGAMLVNRYEVVLPNQQVNQERLERSAKKSVMEKVCRDEMSTSLLKKGATLKYVYSSSLDVTMFEFAITNADCAEL